MKMFRILFILFIAFSQLKAYSQCNVIIVNSFVNIMQTGVDVQYSCCQAGIYHLEYGLSGFTPGTTQVPGTGGTVVIAPPNPGVYSITGLLIDQLYDVYIRVLCDTGGWTANSIVKTFRTAGYCNSGATLTCGNDYQVVLPAGLGAWPNYFCSIPGAKGREKFHRYTATITGNHIFHRGTSSGNTNKVTFRYRSSTLVCNELDWICLGTAPTGAPTQLQFGPLIAGHTYIFMADAEYDIGQPDTASFRIECPTVNCPAPTSVNINSVSPVSEVINYTGTTAIFEYGPPGFTPGTMSVPGTNGISQVVNPGSTVSGFTPGTLYQGYLRTFCSSGTWPYYSQNVGPFYFQTYPCRVPVTFSPVNGIMQLYLNYQQPPDSYYNGNCYWITTPGEDVRLKFQSPKTAKYTVNIGNPQFIWAELSMKELDTVCLPSTYDCVNLQSGTNGNLEADLGTLLKDTTYDFILDLFDSIPTDLYFNIECNGPENITATNISPTSVELNWDCNCLDTTFIEFGPIGFVPGDGYNIGVNGTLFTTTDTSIIISGLTPFTQYDFYLKSSCVTFFSENKKIPVFTPKNCSLSTNLNCGDEVLYDYDATLWYYPVGAWNFSTCGSGTSGAEEYIYKFTPAQSGMYSIYVYNLTSNWTGYIFTAKYFYKHDSLGCNPDNWNCIGSVSSLLLSFTPQTLTFGPLTAGETYYIMTDGPGFTYHYNTFYARLLCPGVCSGPLLTYAFPVNPDAAMVYANCASCFTNGILEVGPAGFTPGSDSTAGVNGTVYHNVTFPYNITGLSPGITYDVYARSDCTVDSTGFSLNSGPISFTTCSSIPTSITTNINNNIICEGESVVLMRDGGVAAPGAVYRWYEGGCGFGNFIGTGDSITVSPSQTQTYFLRSEAPCGNTGCVSITITVSNSIPAIIGNTNLCPGDSTVLNTQILFNQYIWSTGDTTSGINVYSPGLYTVSVLNQDGCWNSNTVQVSQIPFQQPQISGNPFFCEGDSVILFAGNGYVSYLWSDSSTASTITVSDSGSYSVIVANQFGCFGYDSVFVNLLLNPAVSIFTSGPTSFCVGDSLKLSATSGLTGWQWYKNGLAIPGAADSILMVKSAGNYHCVGHDSFECSNISNVLSITTPCIVIGPPVDKINHGSGTSDQFSAAIISDPVGESIIIRIKCEKTQTIQLEIFDFVGRKIQGSAVRISDEDYELTFSESAGVYFVRVKCGSDFKSLKFFKGN